MKIGNQIERKVLTPPLKFDLYTGWKVHEIKS